MSVSFNFNKFYVSQLLSPRKIFFKIQLEITEMNRNIGWKCIKISLNLKLLDVMYHLITSRYTFVVFPTLVVNVIPVT